MKNSILISIIITLAACSGDTNDNETTPKNDHIWKTQTDTLDDAKNLAEQLNEEFKKKAQQMEEAQK